MRRLLTILLAVTASFGGASILLAPAGPAGAQAAPDNLRRGLVYDDLRNSALGSFCGGAYESLIEGRVSPSMKQVICTHGPDPAPEGVDVRADRGPGPVFPTAVQAAEGVPCYGNGSDGYRVQLVYARNTTAPDRFPTYAASFSSWAARMDQIVNDSAAETAGTRHIRFVTDGSCNPVISRTAVSSSAINSFSSLVSELHAQGFNRTDRKYVVWTDANVYCGISELYIDDSADATPGRNYNNGNPYIQGSIGRIDNGCWGFTNMVEAHELLHLLGGVQATAPNATPGYHCKDESDRLCYADGSAGAVMRQVCPAAHEQLYDCNHDDYFSTSPAPGSYLDTHWNTASSAFLTAQGPSNPIPTTTTTTAPPPTTTTSTSTTTTSTSTTTTVPPTTTTTATTTTLPPSTTTTLGPPGTTTTTTTLAPGAGPPSAPQGLAATQPAVGAGVQLAWQAPTSGPVTGYRIYRGTTPYTQTLLATVGNVLGYSDTTAARTLYFYRITASNAAGEGPSSQLTGMIGKEATPAGTVREDVDRRMTISDPRLGPLTRTRWA